VLAAPQFDAVGDEVARCGVEPNAAEPAEAERADYLGVFDVDDIKLSDDSLSFRFVRRLSWL
jgi:hypothetical protein